MGVIKIRYTMRGRLDWAADAVRNLKIEGVTLEVETSGDDELLITATLEKDAVDEFINVLRATIPRDLFKYVSTDPDNFKNRLIQQRGTRPPKRYRFRYKK
jgi:hypothetical protein